MSTKDVADAWVESSSTFGWDDEEADADAIFLQFWETVLPQYIDPLILHLECPASISISEFGSIAVAFDDGNHRAELLFNRDGTYSVYMKSKGESSVAHKTKMVDLNVLKEELSVFTEKKLK